MQIHEATKGISIAGKLEQADGTRAETLWREFGRDNGWMTSISAGHR
jgi:hypothetical protein